MKTSKKIAILAPLFATFVIAACMVVVSCQKSKVEKEERQDIAAELWAEYIFNESVADHTIITTYSDGGFTTEAISNASSLSRDIAIEKMSNWTAYGKVCNRAGAILFYIEMTNIYGSGCYQMQAGAADAKGCRMMSHRACDSRVD
jgi:predicted lipase